METLQELVEQRKGYKYLDKDGKSPYQEFIYDLESSRILVSNELDEDLEHDCGQGWNLATLNWIADYCLKLEGVIVEFSIPMSARIIVPKYSDGKFRTDQMKVEKIHTLESLFPFVKRFNKRLREYKPINLITAETMPPIEELKEVMASVKGSVKASTWGSINDSYWDLAWDSAKASINASVNASIMASEWASVGASARASIWDSVWDSVRESSWESSWDSIKENIWEYFNAHGRISTRKSVWGPVWKQLDIYGFYAIKEFLGLVAENPVFDLIRLGIIVVPMGKRYRIFGKGGKFLGEIDI